MDEDKKLIDKLPGMLLENAERRQKIWDCFYEKYALTDQEDNVSFKVSELTDDLIELAQTEHYTNKVVLENASPFELELTDVIENQLHSELNKLVLFREKTKQLLMLKEYDTIHSIVKKEVRRLKKFCSLEDIEKYICLCITPKEGVQDYIEKKLESNIKMLVTNQFKSLDEEDDDYKMWNQKLVTEFDYLTKVLPEEDVVKYMTNVLRQVP